MPWQVLGVELLRTKVVSETHKLVVEHLARIRGMAGFEDSTAVLCLESNLGYECQHITLALTRAEVPRWVVLNEGAGGTIGFLTTNQTKEQMMMMTRDALRVGCIALADGFFSTTMSENDALEKLRDELGRFSVVVEPPHTLFGKPRRTFTGKQGAQQDDLAIAFQLCMIAIRTFHMSSKYQRYRD